MVCQKCGTQVPDGINVCPTCGNIMDNQTQAQAQYQQPQYQQPQYQQAPPQYQQSQYQQAPPQYQQPQFQQAPQYNNPMYVSKHQDAETAKTLGILSIIMAFFIPLACWICGGIGLSKANDVIRFAQMQNDTDLLEKATTGKKYCKTGLIISFSLIAFITVIYIIVFAVALSSNY